MYSVYKHTVPNGKRYIGLTMQDVKARWSAGWGYRSNAHFWAAIVKYGWNNITHEVVASDLTVEQASALEAELIAAYNTTDRHYGYNHESGGTEAYTVSEETREKQRLAKLGKKASLETRQKMSSARKGRSTGPISEERKQILREAHKDHKNENLYKPVEQRTKTGELVAVYASATVAADVLNCNRRNIQAVCRGERKYCLDCTWSYVERI